MDRLDLKLLEALQADASRTNAELAEIVGLSPSSCLRRVRRLKASGVITKTVAVVDPTALGKPLMAIIEVELERHDHQHLSRFLAKAAAEPIVTHAYAVTGELDAVLILRFADMDAFTALTERLFRNLSTVARFRTMIVHRIAKEDPAIPLEQALARVV